MRLHPVDLQDRDRLLSIAAGTGLFTANEAESLLGGVLDGLASGELPQGHEAVACRRDADGVLMGWTYFAPDPYAGGVWNLWWLGVAPEFHGAGAGVRLLRHAERTIASRGGRVLVIETSDTPALGRARRFYAAQGYRECGRIPDFYADGEAKVVFARRPRGD